jgi:hypothetical protein
MKTIALSMIFSLAFIVCEQQTLFAPHYTDFGGRLAVTSKTSPQNSVVPIAGVNRLVPVASSSSSRAIVHPQYSPSSSRAIIHPNYSPSSSRAIVHPEFSPSGPDLKPTVNGVSLYDHIRGEKDQPFDNDLGRIHDDSAFLPWHRGYFGLTGSASPGGDDI